MTQTPAPPSWFDALAVACSRNSTELVGPVDATEVATFVRDAASGSVALPIGDPLVDRCGLRDAFADALLPDAPDWRTKLAASAVGVTGSVVAVAETGTIAVATGAGRPRALSLVPPHHVCLVDEASIVPTLADAFARLPEQLASAITWISGPSRTGDLEMISTVGIHGPLAVTFVVVRSA